MYFILLVTPPKTCDTYTLMRTKHININCTVLQEAQGATCRSPGPHKSIGLCLFVFVPFHFQFKILYKLA